MKHAIFQVGEVAILQNCRNPAHNGIEVIIVGELRERNILFNGDVYQHILSYEVETPFIDRKLAIVEPHGIRKKQLPREDIQIITWNECPWQPSIIKS